MGLLQGFRFGGVLADGIHHWKQLEVDGDVFGFFDDEERGLRGGRVFL